MTKARKIIPREDDEQTSLAQYLDLLLGELSWFHVPNGGLRNMVVANKLKAQGVKEGVPDVFITKRSQKVIDAGKLGIVIELKRINMKPSDLKPRQREWIDALATEGWICYVAKGWQDAARFLGFWGY